MFIKKYKFNNLNKSVLNHNGLLMFKTVVIFLMLIKMENKELEKPIEIKVKKPRVKKEKAVDNEMKDIK